MLPEWDKLSLQGNLVTVKAMQYSDVRFLSSIFSPDHFIHAPYRYQNCLDFVGNCINARENGLSFPFVFIDTKTGAYVGTSSFLNIAIVHKRLEIGSTWFGKNYQGKGYNPESKLLLLSYLFKNQSFVRVEFKTDALNLKSQAAMEKLGFIKEGVFRKHILTSDGRFRDSVYYSVIDSDWLKIEKNIQDVLDRNITKKNYKEAQS